MEGMDLQISNVSVGGKLTGRDDNSTTFTSSYEASVYIKNLYDKFEKERNSDAQLQQLCEELDFLNTQSQNETVVGLESKLIAGGKAGFFINWAEELKQKFFKKLMLNSQLSLVAQDINVHILAKVRNAFIMEVYPLICRNEDEARVNMIITERIINPVRAELGINLFKYTDEDIMGMVFYLTGNCHIKWCL
jgi:hypothetical protein